jgi:hypothetical protein
VKATKNNSSGRRSLRQTEETQMQQDEGFRRQQEQRREQVESFKTVRPFNSEGEMRMNKAAGGATRTPADASRYIPTVVANDPLYKLAGLLLGIEDGGILQKLQSGSAPEANPQFWADLVSRVLAESVARGNQLDAEDKQAFSGNVKRMLSDPRFVSDVTDLMSTGASDTIISRIGAIVDVALEEATKAGAAQTKGDSAATAGSTNSSSSQVGRIQAQQQAVGEPSKTMEFASLGKSVGSPEELSRSRANKQAVRDFIYRQRRRFAA